jgi:hypothetical protein
MKNLINKIINISILLFTSAIAPRPHHLLPEYLFEQRQRLRGFRLNRLPEPLLYAQLVVRQVQKQHELPHHLLTHPLRVE